LSLDCSAGFYVRSLAHDLGSRLGVGAHLAALRRTASAGLTLHEAVPLAVAERDPDDARRAVMPLERMLTTLPVIVLSPEGLQRAIHGRDLGAADVRDGSWPASDLVRLFDEGGHLIGIGEAVRAPRLLHPSVVLR
jgi:tRNA pseudouridine55 synthase